MAKRKQTSQNNDIRFSIVKIITSSNNLDVEYISLNNELKNICDGNSHSKLKQIGRGDSDCGGSSIEKEQEIEIDQQNNRVQNVGESAKSQDFFQNNKVANHQKKIKYTTTRIKSRSFFVEHCLHTNK